MSLTRLARRRGFHCLHRYEVKDWTTDRNELEFGACFTPNGHGHTYELEAYFEGPVDPLTGMIVNIADIDKMLAASLEPIEGKHLNFEVPEFKDTVPTTEVLAEYLMNRLFKSMKKSFKGLRLVKVRLFESDSLWVDVWP